MYQFHAPIQEIFYHSENYAKWELEEKPSFLEAMKKCTQMEITKRAKMNGPITEELKDKSNKDWKKCMGFGLKESERRFVELNHKGQAELRRQKLVEMLKDNEALRQLVRTAGNGKINIY
jgi:hypothetical protein